MAHILIIDDNPDICDTMESLITRLTHECEAAHTLAQGLERIRQGDVDVVFLDVSLPDGNGLDILPEIMAQPEPPEVIILTGQGDPDGAELAIEGGAWDYLLKPSSVRDISLTLGRALKYREERLGKSGPDRLDLSLVVGESSVMQASFKLMAQAARSETNVLITGETGTGKELFARTIHDNSDRNSGSFVVVDCASLTESLVESTLFGHRKGAFTGAQSAASGWSSWRTAAPCFWTRWAKCRSPSRNPFCACFRSTRSGPWATHANSPATSDSWQPRTAIWTTGSIRGNSVRTCSSASRPCASICRRCASAPRTSRPFPCIT